MAAWVGKAIKGGGANGKVCNRQHVAKRTIETIPEPSIVTNIAGPAYPYPEASLANSQSVPHAGLFQ